MNTIEGLIQKWETELRDLESRYTLGFVQGDIVGSAILLGKKTQLIGCLVQLKNLPNELRAVNRNEAAKEVCPNYDNCKNKGKNEYCDLRTFNEIDCFKAN